MSDMRMVQLLTTQVSQYWPLLRPMIEKGLTPITVEDPNRMANILEDICSGRLTVHTFCYVNEDASLDIVAVLLSGKVWSFGSRHRDLLLYSFAGRNGASFGRDDWLFGFELLKKYAKGNGCKRLVTYSRSKPVMQLVEKAGGHVEASMLTLEV